MVLNFKRPCTEFSIYVQGFVPDDAPSERRARIPKLQRFYPFHVHRRGKLPPLRRVLRDNRSWGKGGKVTAVGRQVTLCDPM